MAAELIGRWLLAILVLWAPVARAAHPADHPEYAREDPLYDRPVLPFVWWDEYFFAPNLLELETESLLGELQHHDDLWPRLRIEREGEQLVAARELAHGRATETYRFVVRDGRYFELAEVHTLRDSGEASRITFDPPLPDLRYGAPVGRFASRFVYQTDGTTTKQRGELVVSADLRPHTARVVLVSRKPRRFHKKPVVAHLIYNDDGDVDMRAVALAPGQAQLSTSSMDAPDPVDRIEALAGVDFAWEERPHRVSHFEVRVPGARGEGDPGFMRFDGGTWASGAVASDQMHYVVRTRELEGAHFYRVATPTFDLVQPVDPHRSARYVKGVHELRLRFRPGELPEDDRQIAVFVNGFALESSYFHDDTGSTVIGYGLDVSFEREGDELRLRSTMLKGIAAVPERIQWLGRYAGFAAMDVVVAVLDQPPSEPPTLRHSGGQRGMRFGGRPRGISCGAEGVIDADFREDPVVFDSFMFWLDHRIFPGRFIRRMSMYADETTFQDRVNNAGWVARPMFLEARKTLQRLDLPVAVGACYEGVGNGSNLLWQPWLRTGSEVVESAGMTPAQLITAATGIPPVRIEGTLPDEPVNARIDCVGTTPTEAVLAWLHAQGLEVAVEERPTRSIRITGAEAARSRPIRQPYCVQKWRGARLHVKGCDVAEVARTLEHVLETPVVVSEGVSGPVDVVIRVQMSDLGGSVRRALQRYGFAISEGTEDVPWLVVRPE